MAQSYDKSLRIQSPHIRNSAFQAFGEKDSRYLQRIKRKKCKCYSKTRFFSLFLENFHEKYCGEQEKGVPLQRFNTAIDCFTLKIIQTKMKKLVFMFAAFAAISFASCGSKTEAPVEANDSDSVVVDTCDTVCDSVVTDTVAA